MNIKNYEETVIAQEHEIRLLNTAKYRKENELVKLNTDIKSLESKIK